MIRAIAAGPFPLTDAQLVVAREDGLDNWTKLKQRIAANSAVKALDAAIRAADGDSAVRMVQTHPEPLHIYRCGAGTGDRR